MEYYDDRGYMWYGQVCNGVAYTIKQNDTLYSISRQYNVSVSDLIMANPFINVYNLRIGMEICIPTVVNEPTQPREYIRSVPPGMQPQMPPQMQPQVPEQTPSPVPQQPEQAPEQIPYQMPYEEQYQVPYEEPYQAPSQTPEQMPSPMPQAPQTPQVPQTPQTPRMSAETPGRNGTEQNNSDRYFSNYYNDCDTEKYDLRYNNVRYNNNNVHYRSKASSNPYSTLYNNRMNKGFYDRDRY